MNITDAWSEFTIVPFPHFTDQEEAIHVRLKGLDTFATECIAAYVRHGSLATSEFRLLKRCMDNLQRELPALTGDVLLYFEQLSELGMCVLDRSGA